jgi:anaerobic ribonucleoside-triphosphate reductase
MTEKDNGGFHGTCEHCGSKNIEAMTRVTGFFSKVGSWNKGKVGELKDRRDAIAANQGHFKGGKE